MSGKEYEAGMSRTHTLESDSSGKASNDIKDLESQGYAEQDIQVENHQILDDVETRKYERAYMWKLDCIICPTISLLYFFEYLDRGNVAVRNVPLFINHSLQSFSWQLFLIIIL